MAMSCPRCAASLVGEHGFVTWCARCDFNVDPLRESRAVDVHSKSMKRQQQRMQRLDERVLNHLLSGQRVMSGVRLRAVALALTSWFIVLTALGMFVLAALIVVTSRAPVFSLIFAVPLAVAGVVGVLGSTPGYRVRMRVNPTDHPILASALDDAAAAMKVRRVRRVFLDMSWNASAGRDRFGRREMTLGIPLIAGLTPGQRAHVVAHELGHFSNGDSSRGFVQSAALRYLYNWYAALDDAASYGLAGLLVVPLKWPLAGAILLKQRLIAEGRLLGEHRADLAGARWTSADSAVQALARINGAVETYERLVSSWVRRRDHAPEPMQDVASALAAVPQSEQRRWLRVVELDRHIGVGDLHPSNASRVEVIRALTAPGVIGDVHGWGRIDAELAAPAREMAMALRRGSSMG